MNHVVGWSVRNRFMVAFVLVAVIPLVIFAALVYTRTAKALREVEKSQIAAHATGAREALGQRVTDQRAFVRDYAVWDEFHAAMLAERRQWIRDNVTGWVPDSSSTDLVTVYDPSGRVVSRAGDGDPGSLWASELVRAARRGKTGADLVDVGGKLHVLAAAPIVAQTHPSRAAGVLVFGEVITNAVLSDVSRFTGGQSRLAVSNADGVTAASESSEGDALAALGPAELAGGRVVSEGDYASQLVALTDERGATVAHLLVSVPRDDFAAVLGEIDLITMAAFVVALVVALTIGLIMARKISTPLTRLAAAATALSHGERHEALPTGRRDEIGSLARAFDSMSERVAARIDGLSEKTQSLALEISNLSAFGATLAQTPDPLADLQHLADMVRTMLDADMASVFLVYEGHTARAAFSGGQESPIPTAAADELAAWAVEHRQGLEVADAETDERLSALARATTPLRSLLVVPLTRQEGVVGALVVGFRDQRDFGPEEIPLLATIGGQIAVALQNAEAYEKLDRMYLETVTALAAAMEAKDQYTASHADTLATTAVAVGSRMGLTDAELRMLQYAAVLHDIGKIGIPGNILNKPEALTREEFDTMAQHTVIGERIISRIDYLVPIARIIRSAHERWDGTGYPDGLRGEEIPLASRILLVCDAFDAMTTDRPYRRALPIETALGELDRNAGTQFDPRVVDVFLAAYPFETPETDRGIGRFSFAGMIELN